MYLAAEALRERKWRSKCGFGAVQYVGACSVKPGYAITFVASVARNGNGAIVTEYYVPDKFQKRNGKWISPEHRVKIIPFPRRKGSQHDIKACAWPLAPVNPLLRKAVR